MITSIFDIPAAPDKLASLLQNARSQRHEPRSASAKIEADKPHNVARARSKIKTRITNGMVLREGSRDDTTYQLACVAYEEGVGPETAVQIIAEELLPTKLPGDDWTADNIEAKVASVYSGNVQNEFGSTAIASGVETFAPHVEKIAASVLDAPLDPVKHRFKAMLYDEYSTLPPPELLFKELNLPRFGAGFINAEMEAFKTFILGGKVALALARGHDFHFGSGLTLTVNEGCQGAGFLFLGEAANGVGNRRQPSLFDAAKIPETERNNVPLFLIPDVPRVALGMDDEAREVVATIRENMRKFPDMRVALVVLDTLSKMLAGLDMNSSKDMTAAIAIAERVQREFQCCVVILHHVNADDPERGHGSRTVGRDVDFNAFIVRPKNKLCCKWSNGKDKDEGMRDSEVFFEMVPHLDSLVPDVIAPAKYFKLASGSGLSDEQRMLAALIGLGCYPEGPRAAKAGDPTTGCGSRDLARAMQRLDGYVALPAGQKPTVEQESALEGSIEKWRGRIDSLTKPARKKKAQLDDCRLTIRPDGKEKPTTRYAIAETRWESLGPLERASLLKAAQPLLGADDSEEEVPC
jgi:hypothetical protein